MDKDLRSLYLVEFRRDGEDITECYHDLDDAHDRAEKVGGELSIYIHKPIYAEQLIDFN